MDPTHEHSTQSDDEYAHLDDRAFARMVEKSIGLGEPTEIEQSVMNESLSYRHHQTDERQVSQAIYSILLPQKIQEVKDEEIFQSFRPPAVGADDPLLTAPWPVKSNEPLATSGKKSTIGKLPRDGAAALLWGKKASLPTQDVSWLRA
ncbi:hypothetical protein RhiJN_05732 [Ceratobasidium sp. AG-Ba]|nr:hypothetical protein RhiJN_05732 [Ceratobasidium sp. AG-Ba]